MLIMDAMHRLNSRYEVEFLLTAYVETLQFYGAAKQLPPGVALLPLRGIDDIESRLIELSGSDACGQGHAHQRAQNAISREATEIFDAARMRLQALSAPIDLSGS